MTKKDEVVSIRVRPVVKAELIKVAAEESRSLSQTCELLLMVGLASYRKSGSGVFKSRSSSVKESKDSG
jgi:hypothetical protein